MSIGNRIKEILDDKNMTVVKLSQISNIPATTIYSIIKSSSDDIKYNILEQLSKALGVQIWDILGISRKIAQEHSAEFDEWKDFMYDEDEIRNYQLHKEAFEKERSERVEYYYENILPLFKKLNIKVRLLFDNDKHYIYFKNEQGIFQMNFDDIKEIIDELQFLVEYKITAKAIPADEKLLNHIKNNPIISKDMTYDFND